MLVVPAASRFGNISNSSEAVPLKKPPKTYARSVFTYYCLHTALVNRFVKLLLFGELVSVFTVSKIPIIKIINSVDDFYSYFIQIISSQSKINQVVEL